LQIQEKVGSGAYGLVFKSKIKGKSFYNTVALKVLYRYAGAYNDVKSDELSALFCNEWDVLAELPLHPNIVNFIYQFTAPMPIEILNRENLLGADSNIMKFCI